MDHGGVTAYGGEMAGERPLLVVFYYRKISRYALNVLAGALESAADTAPVPLVFPATLPHLLATLEEALAAGQRCLVLWSFYSTQTEEIRQELQQVKTALPMQPLLHLAGGVHASAEPRATLAMGFDYVAVGEGEYTLQEVVRALLRNGPLHAIPGVYHAAAAALSCSRRGRIANLDEFSCGSRYYHKYGPVEISRGCVFACRFCQTPYLHKARFRHRSLARIVAEVAWLRADGFSDIRFISPSALSYGADGEGVEHGRLEGLLAAVRGVMGDQGRIYFGTFPSEVRPEHVTERTLRILARYVDNDNLVIGGQSGSQRLLDAMRRGHSVQDVRRAAELCLSCGFRPNIDFLFGFPGESADDIAVSTRFALELADLGARIHLHSFMPLPGTPLAECSAVALPEHLVEQLQNLVAQGKAYGQWQTQRRVAEKLRRPQEQ